MPRTGTRPHVWKVQGKRPHDQYVAWQKSKAQAAFRNETWQLTFEDYQWLWREHWDMKGRGIDQYCMTRSDPQGSWSRDNSEILTRREHFQRKADLYREKSNGKKL